MAQNELKRFFCTIDFVVSKSKQVLLTLVDSHDIRIKHTAITTVQKLEDKDLIVHDGKNFHLVIMPNGEWNIYWIKDNRLSSDEENIINKALDELFDLHYKRK